MYIKTKNTNKYVHLTKYNFDGLNIDEKKKNVMCIIRGKVTSLGVYSGLSDEINAIFLDTFFRVIYENIDSDKVIIMPKTDEQMEKRINKWAEKALENDEKETS